jgi:hypothetical protein
MRVVIFTRNRQQIDKAFTEWALQGTRLVLAWMPEASEERLSYCLPYASSPEARSLVEEWCISQRPIGVIRAFSVE